MEEKDKTAGKMKSLVLLSNLAVIIGLLASAYIIYQSIKQGRIIQWQKGAPCGTTWLMASIYLKKKLPFFFIIPIVSCVILWKSKLKLYIVFTSFGLALLAHQITLLVVGYR